MIRLSLQNADAVSMAMLNDLAFMGKAVPRAAAAAINATLKRLQTISVRLLQERYTVKAGDLTRKAAIYQATANNLYGVLSFKDKRGLGLINFQARPAQPALPRRLRPKEGASVKVLRQGARKNPRRNGQKAFAVRLKHGNVHLVTRQGDKLETLYGPHPLAALRQAGAEAELKQAASEELSHNLREQLDKLMAGKRA